MIMVWQVKNTPVSFNRLDARIPFAIKKSYIALALCLSISSVQAIAGEYFNPHLLEVAETNSSPVDLSWLAQESVPPGEYSLDVFINNQFVATETLVFNPEADKAVSVQPCVSLQQLKEWNVKTESYPELSVVGSDCVRLSAIPDAELAVSLSRQRIDFTFPQIAMLTRPRGYVPEAKWDQGISAGLLNYSLSGQNSTPRNEGEATNSQFVSLQPGINIGPWRFRNYSTWNHDDNGSDWKSVYSYISRDIHFLRSQLVLGNTYTASGIFDSISFTGVQLNSDKEMLPDSQHGFAPVIKGIARTTAEVTVWQNGYSIYKTTVSPGAFEISDLYSTGSAGDLYVTVKESDGSESSFVVPYASLAVLQREGQFDYAFSSGKTRSGSPDDKEYNFIQSTVAYGATSNVTVYSGFQQAEDKYTNLLLGAGFNLGAIGALSFDASQSWAEVRAQEGTAQTKTRRGQSYRVRFSKSLPQTGTNFSVAGYRYSTHGYYSFQDFINDPASYRRCCSWNGRTKDRVDATISQTFSHYGSLSLSLVNESYWNNSRMESLGLGYSNSLGRISYFINYSYNRNVQSNSDEGNEHTNDNVISLTVSIPFGAATSASYSMSSSRAGDTIHSVGLNGTAFEDRSLNWSLQEGYNASDKRTSGNVSLNYQGAKGEVAAGYGYDDYSNRYNYSLRGGMAVHSGGVTFSRVLGESVALIEAPGVANAAVRGQTNVTTDGAGYAIVPYVRAYHENNLSLDEGEVAGAEIDNVTRTVVPTRNAVVKVRYSTSVGYKSMMTLSFQGKTVPFGALVSLEGQDDESRENKNAIVGDEGQVYLTGLPQKGELFVKWGDSGNKQCRVNYNFSVNKGTEDIIFYQAECR